MITAKPVRLQRKRTKGFHLESPNGLEIVYVGRPTQWGNNDDFSNSEYETERIGSIMRYSETIDMRREYSSQWFEEWIAPLRGKNLSCWCPLDQLCHADILLELANEVKDEQTN